MLLSSLILTGFLLLHRAVNWPVKFDFGLKASQGFST
jgi:hypothetical protein